MVASRLLVLLVLVTGVVVGGGWRVWVEGRGFNRWQEKAVEPPGASPGDSARILQKSAPPGRLDENPISRQDEPGMESVERILSTRGLEQSERLARFLPLAGPAELEQLYLGLEEQHGQVGETLGDALFLRWMQVDPKSGLAFAEKQGRDGMSWWAWGKVDPEAAVAAALKLKSPDHGIAVLRAIGQGDPGKARELLDQHPQWQTSSAMNGLAAGLMKSDPADGATLVATWNSWTDQDKLVSTWARRDPDAALAWARELPDQARRAEAMGVLLEEWAVTHPDRVAPAVLGMPDGRTKWELYAKHAARLGATDSQAASAWVAAAPSAPVRRAATLAWARGLVAQDPEGALNVLKTMDWSPGAESLGLRIFSPSGIEESHSDRTDEVLHSIASHAPEAAMRFVASLPPEAPAEFLTRATFEPWVNRQSLEASQWLASQPQGPVKDAGIDVLVANLVTGPAPDFEAAMQWALASSQEDKKIDQVLSVLRNWKSHDPEAAAAALADPRLPPEIRNPQSEDALNP